MQGQKDYSIYSDQELVVLASTDSEALDYLLEKYKNIVKAKARTYFLMGADKEDLIQEGMIGLYKAIRDYKEEKQVSFHAFAELCITRQIITAIKTATRQKHQPLNSYISLNKPIHEEESEKEFSEVVSLEKEKNPEEIVIDKENLLRIQETIQKLLSDFETKVLKLYLDGKSYQEIAERLERSPKSVDNALQRIKAKLEKHLEEEKNREKSVQ